MKKFFCIGAVVVAIKVFLKTVFDREEAVEVIGNLAKKRGRIRTALFLAGTAIASAFAWPLIVWMEFVPLLP